MYTNTCNACLNVWETRNNPDPICPKCNATGPGLIGFTYNEDNIAESSVTINDTAEGMVVEGNSEPNKRDHDILGSD